MIFEVSSTAWRLMSTAKTLAPSRANRAAVALPFPHPGPTEPAPVTIAILSFKRSPIDASPSIDMDCLALNLPFETFSEFGLEDFAIVVLRQAADKVISPRPF